MKRLCLFIVLMALVGSLLYGADPVENSVRVVEERAMQPQQGSDTRDDLSAIDPGLRLYWMLADDHVRIVRSIADVTGDGIAE